ncbi:MAG TPA: cysteine methyltransferase [Fibrobacteres bacterium]|jgi:methylated-DNA-[protein]-cysteine S-methyltransferase|nr:cysteine methyltransferase [Fibrobacterota bacterium]
MTQTALINSPIGSLRLTSDEKGLTWVDFLRSKRTTPSKYAASFRLQEKALKDFFTKGKSLPKFSFGDRGGTEFQRKVWREIEKIPLGKTRTYADIAKAIGKPGASRAVGSACGANPIPLFVPCHRVVASNGGLGGFSGGLDIKKKLLRLEGAL